MPLPQHEYRYIFRNEDPPWAPLVDLIMRGSLHMIEWRSAAAYPQQGTEKNYVLSFWCY